MKIANAKAHFDYTILERFEAGVSLFGSEVKSLRLGHASLDGSYVKVVGNEIMLLNAHIYPYAFATAEGGSSMLDSKRSRKLLLHKREILKIRQKVAADGLTLIPVFWYTKGHRVKLEIALARGKKQYEKREIIKKREDKRNLERDFRGKMI